MSVRCPDCETQLAGSPSFCPDCGAKLNSGDVTAPAPPPESGSSRPRSSPDGRFVTGQRLGERYRIVEQLGHGAMGEVYRADDLELGQSVALKFLPERLATDDQALQRLRGEVRLARGVSHANVCRVYDLTRADGHTFITMEYIDGEDLSDVLRRLGRPSPEKAEEFARQICSGLAAAHDVGVLHRDLKPSNIMIDGRGRARVTDFGLAGLAEDLEETAELAGTPAYMAPEQITEGRVSVQSDIYSLGLVLHELFTGRRVFETDSVQELRSLHDSGSSTSFGSTQVDPAIERAIKRCLETEPHSRPRSVYDVLASLPGGDPLAAAIAAGETPSPELVASDRSRGPARPIAVAGAVLWIVGSLVASISMQKTQFPDRPTSELTGVALDIARDDLGLSPLPPHDAFGLMQNPWHETPGARPYLVWRRWTNEPLESSDFHHPWRIQWNDPPHRHPGSTTVVVDDVGHLVEAQVIVEPHRHNVSLVSDFRPILDRAGIDPDAVSRSRIEPHELKVPISVICDHVTVWHESSDEAWIARAAVYAGRIVAFQRADAPSLWEPPEEAATITSSITASSDPKRTPREPGRSDGGKVGMEREGWKGLLIIAAFEEWIGLLIIAAFVLMFGVAVRNLQRGRGDLSGAFRTAVVMLAFYVSLEVLSFDLDRGLADQFASLLWLRSGAHPLLHAVSVGLLYLAFEPIARRVWPRVLVGWVRVLAGRWRDSRVGVELLIGLGVVSTIALSWSILHWNEAGGLLGGESLWSLSGPVAVTRMVLYASAVALLWTLQHVAYIGFGHLVTRSSRAALALGAGLIALQLLVGFGLMWSAIVAVAAVVVFVQGGFVALFAFWWMLQILMMAPLTTDLTAWHAPSTIFVLVVIGAVLAYGASAAVSTASRNRAGQA